MRKLIHVSALAVIGLGITACQVEKTKDGKLPEVNVQTTEGQLPEYNVQGPDVEVGSKNETVQVPTVKVTTPAEKK